MNWPTVVRALRDASNKDASRSAEARREQKSAAADMLALLSVLQNRLASALEAGHVADGIEPIAEVVVVKRGRKNKDPNEPSKRVQPNERSKAYIASGWGKQWNECGAQVKRKSS